MKFSFRKNGYDEADNGKNQTRTLPVIANDSKSSCLGVESSANPNLSQTKLREGHIVEIQFFQPEGELFYVYDINTFLINQVSLVRRPDPPTVAVTWFLDPKFGMVGIKKVGQLKQDVDEAIDAFIIDYLSANQKQ